MCFEQSKGKGGENVRSNKNNFKDNNIWNRSTVIHVLGKKQGVNVNHVEKNKENNSDNLKTKI